jgi:hypothetical protein
MFLGKFGSIFLRKHLGNIFFGGGNLSGFEWDKSGEHHKTWMNNWEVGWIVSRKFQWIGLREILQERPRFNGKMDGFL